MFLCLIAGPFETILLRHMRKTARRAEFQILYKNDVDSNVTILPVAGKYFEQNSLFHSSTTSASMETMTDISRLSRD